jgi:ABC-type branched-subunit amino acid transport system substrate-binding protein
MNQQFFFRSALLAILLTVSISMTAWGFKWPWQAEEEVGVTDTEIVVGSHTDLSGPAAGWGAQVKMGMELKAKEINEAGGVHGRKIRLVIEDNAYDPAKAITVTNKMITKDKVFVFINNLGSTTAGATKPIISKSKTPQMFPLAPAELFFNPHDRYSFLGYTPYYDQARIVAKYFVKEKGKKAIGLLYQDDEMGEIMKKGLVDQLAMYGMELAATESYKRGDTVFSTQLAKLKKADVDLVVLATVIRETVSALGEVKKLQWDVDVSAMSPAFSMYIPYLAGKAGFSANGLYITNQTPYIYPDHESALARAFYQNYQTMFGKAPDMPSVAGYAALDRFILAADRVGKELTREKLIDELEKFKNEPDPVFLGPSLTFTANDHKGTDQAIMFQIQNNRFVKIMGPLSYQD